ncbi:MAG: hypothetical protein JWQ76_1231 [Ramlibacter sp.]|nr:hypothetical protein [Ramlibacter sp.]
MSALLILVAACGGWRVVRSALATLDSLPSCNEDMVFY